MVGSLHLKQPIRNSSEIYSTDFGQRSIHNQVTLSMKDIRTELKPKAVARKSTTPTPTCYRSLVMDMASGWVGGAMGIAATHPLDCIRVMKQYQARISKNNLSYVEILLRIRDTHGWTGFYRGVIPPSVLRGTGLAANRAAYSIGMQFFKEEKVKGTWRMWVVGAFAGTVNGVVDMPIHLLKCRAQVKLGRTKESFSLYIEMMKRIWMYEGFRAFTNGLIPQLLFYGISYGAFYAIYDYLLSYGCPVAVAGMLAGTTSWPFGLPFDTIRVRMQCQPYNVPFGTAVGEMWRQPIQLWFSGLGMTMLRAAPRWGITMLAIECCNKVLSDNF